MAGGGVRRNSSVRRRRSKPSKEAAACLEDLVKPRSSLWSLPSPTCKRVLNTPGQTPTATPPHKTPLSSLRTLKPPTFALPPEVASAHPVQTPVKTSRKKKREKQGKQEKHEKQETQVQQRRTTGRTRATIDATATPRPRKRRSASQQTSSSEPRAEVRLRRSLRQKNGAAAAGQKKFVQSPKKKDKPAVKQKNHYCPKTSNNNSKGRCPKAEHIAKDTTAGTAAGYNEQVHTQSKKQQQISVVQTPEIITKDEQGHWVKVETIDEAKQDVSVGWQAEELATLQREYWQGNPASPNFWRKIALTIGKPPSECQNAYEGSFPSPICEKKKPTKKLSEVDPLAKLPTLRKAPLTKKKLLRKLLDKYDDAYTGDDFFSPAKKTKAKPMLSDGVAYQHRTETWGEEEFGPVNRDLADSYAIKYGSKLHGGGPGGKRKKRTTTASAASHPPSAPNSLTSSRGHEDRRHVAAKKAVSKMNNLVGPMRMLMKKRRLLHEKLVEKRAEGLCEDDADQVDVDEQADEDEGDDQAFDSLTEPEDDAPASHADSFGLEAE